MSVLYGQDQHNLRGSASDQVRLELSEQQTIPYYQNNQNAAQGSEGERIIATKFQCKNKLHVLYKGLHKDY